MRNKKAMKGILEEIKNRANRGGCVGVVGTLIDQAIALPQKQPPRKIRVLKNVRSGIPGREHISITKGQLYDAEVNKHGAVSACTEYGLLGVKPDEYEFVCKQPLESEFTKKVRKDMKNWGLKSITKHISWPEALQFIENQGKNLYEACDLLDQQAEKLLKKNGM